ncbi:MAG: hypothetical protein GKR89_04095 [Candidatus Latescibacteria bacterium]|nr:hypothetical protein [Candidatus Latescibacterota bacterium]
MKSSSADIEQILAELDLEELSEQYDQAAAQLLEVARQDGYFVGWEGVQWPAGSSLDETALARRLELVRHIHEGAPRHRDERLYEAYQRYQQREPAYHEANRVFLQVRRQFVDQGQGSERDFRDLYQAVYLQALSREDPFPLDAGEEALVQLRVARAPLSLAQPVAEKLDKEPVPDDPRWQEQYTCTLDGAEQSQPLDTILRRVAEQIVDFMAAGEHLAIRYNTFSNFIWFGISIWQGVSEVELVLARLQGRVRPQWHRALCQYVQLAQAMLLKFLQAHSEDPAQIRPKEYWYGQEYSYLTRDMIDLVTGLIDRTNALSRRARGMVLDPVQVPALLRDQVEGRFLEYPHVGRSRSLSAWRQKGRVARWFVQITRQTFKRREQLSRAGLDEAARLKAACANNGEWGRRTLELFGVELTIRIDPRFAQLAAELELAQGKRPVLFFPTHQSLMDHPVMACVLQSPELAQAMGWDGPAPYTQLARAGLTDAASVKVGGRTFSLLGLSPERADELLEEVDGVVVLQRSKESNPTRRFAQVLEQRPGVVYGGGTTAAFELQCLPIQHALFAHLAPEIIIVPMAFRGIHSLWPKCPKGNLQINPGHAEVVVSPPMLGETTLLPRKRALRTQLEPATLFQAVHIATLYNPEPGQVDRGR